MIHNWTYTGPRFVLAQCSGSEDYMFCPRIFTSVEQAMSYRKARSLNSWDVYQLQAVHLTKEGKFNVQEEAQVP